MRAPSRTIASAKRLRRAMTLPEVILWTHLRGDGLHPLRFRRQHPIGPYVLDFYCASARLCVEVDGRAHDNIEVVARDLRRDQWLAENGIRVLRLPATAILDPTDLENSLTAIRLAAAPSPASGGPPPPFHGGGPD
jgi:very-short-patch-repair endonuclease